MTWLQYSLNVRWHTGVSNATITNRNEMHEEIKHRLNSGNACYYALQGLLSDDIGEVLVT